MTGICPRCREKNLLYLHGNGTNYCYDCRRVTPQPRPQVYYDQLPPGVMTGAAAFRESLIQRPIVPVEAQEAQQAIVEHAEKFAEKSNKEVVADLRKIVQPIEEPPKEQRRIVI